MKRIRQLTLVIVALTALAMPAAAHASADQVKQDCTYDGKLDKKYSKQELQKALHTLFDDYSRDCEDVIRAALAAGGPKKSSGGGGGGGGGPAPAGPPARAKPDPKGDAAALGAAKDQKPKLRIGGKPLEPGKNGLFNLSAANGLPTPLLFALIALGLVLVGGALITLRKRVPALARIPLPSLSLGSLRRVSLPRFRR